ncbi:MAG: hypothetical protein AB1921_08325 [Thermodesulfobacteriota bacterium]
MQNKLRRSVYEVLRDDLDQYLIYQCLVSSYRKFLSQGRPYPFVEKKELRPRSRIPQEEHDLQRTFLLVFVEDSIPPIHKKYLRFFDENRATKVNLLNYKAIPLSLSVARNLRHLGSARFYDFLEVLLPVDYALLIQRDPASQARNRYSLTHFHVRVDWPIADAAEDLGRQLRYISKDLYEKGEKYAEDLQKKFFEFYGIPFMAGGRRTAAIVAAQYLKKLPCVSTIYVASSETRSLTRLAEHDVSKSILLKMGQETAAQAASQNGISWETFQKNYVVAREKAMVVVLFRTTYQRTSHARPPEDGKLRELNPDVHWLSIDAEQILPKPWVRNFPPIGTSFVYT